ncbi:Bifunctional protein: zinc-containing alcohol dehydrogenase; quinone oxidoreductase (NADPH:quinone reductase); Similar to arginate lyase [[Actinomadura] parvosata subsp. kistnae]|uniref:NADPH:quinone reductase n=2 Tax=Nonomuraea TaxID=83681 RepID=A0A1U9ZQM3_9ACTN|nr:NADPH:quinone reductase [Nonomuraea sp. ATCC 55076]SPL91271.1 Bifunctional protein: zinc-containing alcohol dehydrogenase; quinone oxidoreductase (NADPH:quinone reductase); Similar to arginate lyase [Actinomadura parvosata subsp. kistnae]
MTDTMRAISQDVLGGPEVLKEIRLPKPEAGLSELLVRVHAAGLNPTDWKHRGVPGLFLGEPPFVLGWDVSGVVEATGPGVTLFKPGDEVFGMLPYPHGAGSHAEYVTGPARAFARKPATLDHVQAGALPLAALTAWQALVDTARIEPGQRVLIHAAAGGVGHLAVQIAKTRGAYVIGTASAPKHDFVRSVGADEVIDYRATDVTEAVRDADVVLDAQGSEHARRSLRSLRPGGLLVSLRLDPGMTALTEEAARLGVRAEVMLVEADHAGMRAIAELAADGRLRAEIAGTFELADAAKAHAMGDTGRTAGKLVLTVE